MWLAHSGVGVGVDLYSVEVMIVEWKIVPLLDLVEALEERDRDEDDDCLLAVADLDLL